MNVYYTKGERISNKKSEEAMGSENGENGHKAAEKSNKWTLENKIYI